MPSPKTYWATKSRPTPSLPPVDGRSMVGFAWSPKATMFLGTVGGQKIFGGLVGLACFFKKKNGQKVVG